MDSAEWDERYSEQDRMWSGRPNGTLVLEAGQLQPGTALDVGCGEGGDALWLAERGWQVTGVDVSRVALTRAEAAARERGVQVTWVCSTLVDLEPAPRGYDLVTVHYPALLHTPQDDAIHALLRAVAPGGTLLVVGHEHVDPQHAAAHGFDPADYVQPPDVAARLDSDWVVEVDEERPRVDPAPPGTEHVRDRVLRARRLPAGPGLAPADETPAEDGAVRVLTVGGERFSVRLRPRSGQLYDYDYDWLTGPNDGYGFGMSGPFEESDAEHEARIRSFLAQIDPETGFLRED